MCNGIKASLFLLLSITMSGAAAAQSASDQPKASGVETDIARIKQAMLGNWESIAPEVRPSAGKSPDGSLKPFYLKRAFKYLPSDRFELEVVNSADPYGAVPLALIKIGGHMLWQGPHPIAAGAQKVDFVADESYEVTRSGICRRAQQGRPGRLRPLGGQLAAEHLREDVCPVRSEGRDEFHGVRSRLPQRRPAVLGRAQYPTAAALIPNRTGLPTCRSRWSESSAGVIE